MELRRKKHRWWLVQPPHLQILSCCPEKRDLTSQNVHLEHFFICSLHFPHLITRWIYATNHICPGTTWRRKDLILIIIGLPWWSKWFRESTCNAGDTSRIPGSGRFQMLGSQLSLCATMTHVLRACVPQDGEPRQGSNLAARRSPCLPTERPSHNNEDPRQQINISLKITNYAGEWKEDRNPGLSSAHRTPCHPPITPTPALTLFLD